MLPCCCPSVFVAINSANANVYRHKNEVERWNSNVHWFLGAHVFEHIELQVTKATSINFVDAFSVSKFATTSRAWCSNYLGLGAIQGLVYKLTLENIVCI